MLQWCLHAIVRCAIPIYGDCYEQVRHLMADFGPARFFSREVPWTNSLCLARYLEGRRLISILGEPNWWQALTAARGGAGFCTALLRKRESSASIHACTMDLQLRKEIMNGWLECCWHCWEAGFSNID